MAQWISHSSPQKQRMLSVSCFLLGILLIISLKQNPISSNTTAGIWLGVLLLVIGGLSLIFSGKQQISVDPLSRCITILDNYLLGSKKQTIRFSEIDDIAIGYLGRKSNGITMYYLELRLKNGKNYPLFSPGRFYEGSTNRQTVESWQQRIEG